MDGAEDSADGLLAAPAHDSGGRGLVQPFGCANGHDLLANLLEFQVSQLHKREIDPFDPKDREPENALYSKDALRYRITRIESIGWGQICKKAVWHC